MRALILSALLVLAALGQFGQVVYAMPIPDARPKECSGKDQVERLKPLLRQLFSDPADLSKSLSTKAAYSSPPTCISPTELTATVVDDQFEEALKRLKGLDLKLATARFGSSLFIDVAELETRPRDVLRALCVVEPAVSNLRLSEGASAFESKAQIKSLESAEVVNGNQAFTRTIEALDASSVMASALSVAVIDGSLRDDHEDLPPIDHRIVTGHVTAAGDCGLGTPCCQAGSYSSVYPHLPHAAWTIGTIAAIQNNGRGIDGLSKPRRIIAIDPGGRSCETMWRLATAVACAVEEKAEVIHYAAEPVAGANMHLLFKPVLDRVVQAGSLIVFPSGNTSIDLDTFPAWPNVFNENALTVAQFAEHGSTASQVGYGAATVDLGLPLGEVATTANCAKDCYGSYDRTSAASAIVTGAILQMSAHANFDKCTAPELSRLLMAFAVPFANPSLRAMVSPEGGQLNLRFLQTVILDAQGKAVDYCAGP